MKTKYLLLTLLVYCFKLDLALSQVDLTKGLVACYPFDGDAKDKTGNGYDGSVSGAVPATDRHGKANSCYFFDGVNDKIEVTGAVISKTEFSIGFWAKTSEFKNSFAFMLVSDNPSDRFAISINYNHNGDTSIFWDFGGIYGNGRWQLIGTNYEKEWEHYVLIVSNTSSTMSVYRNGNLVTTKISAEKLQDNERVLNIGAGDGRMFFHGFLDDVNIYNRALSAQEADSLYKGSVCSPKLGVQAHNTSANDFNIYPNPSTDKIRIRLASLRQYPIEIEIIDLHGRSVGKYKDVNDGDQLEVGELPKGVYVILAKSSFGTVVSIGKLLLGD